MDLIGAGCYFILCVILRLTSLINYRLSVCGKISKILLLCMMMMNVILFLRHSNIVVRMLNSDI